MEDRKNTKAEALGKLRAYEQETQAQRKRREEARIQQIMEDHQEFPTGRLRRKARKLRWRRNKFTSRDELKAFYQDAPWIIRVPRIYLLRPFVILLVIAVLCAGVALAGYLMIGDLISKYLAVSKNQPVSQEEIHKLSPVDKEGAKRIDAVPAVDKDDTWTISIYIVGSNLEDMDENDLSDLVRTQIRDAQEKIEKENVSAYKTRLNSFAKELEQNDLEIPSYLYHPKKPAVGEEHEEESSGATVAEDPGAASIDIGEMTSGKWSDNISVVVQTGGATRWSNELVNPNRTQRFLYKGGVFTEVDNKPLENAADPKTLTSFLNFCKEEYPADHNMLVLWNHGGGAFGYGADSIFGGMMSLADLKEALTGAYEPNEEDPAFDVIGFDACLMSSLEVCHALNGFASYYAVSEETEPGDGWNYAPWLEAMTKDPSMSPAKVCREIADSYMDYYMTQNFNVGWLITYDVTFSVLDASKAEALYDAWCDLTKHQLADAVKDGSVLAEMGRCSNKSTHFVTSVYNVYNTIDLGNYVDLMVDTYPKECSEIRKLIGETVMYHRESGSLSDAQGISVYMPGSVDSYAGLAYALDYIYDICEDPSTRALFYYKIAGCLNEDMKKHLATISRDEPWVLDLKPFLAFSREKPVIVENGFDIRIDEKLQSMLQNYSLEAALYDAEKGLIINYGRDETVRLDGNGNMNCEFDGTWICYDGVPLATEVVSATDSTVEYRSRILYNGKESYISFTWDRDTEEFTINGVRGASDLAGGIFNDDPFNYLINSRMNTEVKKGDKIVPLYDVSTTTSLSEKKDEKAKIKKASKGREIKVSKRSKIGVDKLNTGYYLTSAVIGDQRGDVYYSQVVGNDVSGGQVKSREVDASFVGKEY